MFGWTASIWVDRRARAVDAAAEAGDVVLTFAVCVFFLGSAAVVLMEAFRTR